MKIKYKFILYNFKKMILVAHESRCTFVLSEKMVKRLTEAKDKSRTDSC